jgi:hypothetical protein
MSKLKASDWMSYRALLSKYDRSQDEFRLNEEYLRQSADGTLEGLLWVIYVQTGRGVVFHFDKLRSNWLDSFEKHLQQDAFLVGNVLRFARRPNSDR